MKVLQLSTHATLQPRHGGAIRSHQIGQSLERAGIDLRRIAVCWRSGHEPDDVREPIIDIKQSPFWSSAAYEPALNWDGCFSDFYVARAVAETPALINSLLAHVATASPDLIMLEHPWTWPLIKDLPRVRDGSTRIIYSSHNVETGLKHQMVERAHLNVPASVLDAVEALERDLVQAASATIACTQADANVFRSWGARDVIVANNGTIAKKRDRLLSVLPSPLLPHQRFVLFIGAMYGPNLTGFSNYALPALPRLRPNTRLVVAGSVCSMIDHEITSRSLQDHVDRRLVTLGFVDTFTLDALIANASAILLPIEYGGGSHLKTAEALASGRPIIATSCSFRGFEQHRNLPRVTTADSPSDFETAIHNALSTPSSPVNGAPVPRDLLWESTLDPVVRLVKSLNDSPSAPE